MYEASGSKLASLAIFSASIQSFIIIGKVVPEKSGQTDRSNDRMKFGSERWRKSSPFSFIHKGNHSSVRLNAIT